VGKDPPVERQYPPPLPRQSVILLVFYCLLMYIYDSGMFTPPPPSHVSIPPNFKFLEINLSIALLFVLESISQTFYDRETFEGNDLKRSWIQIIDLNLWGHCVRIKQNSCQCSLLSVLISQKLSPNIITDN